MTEKKVKENTMLKEIIDRLTVLDKNQRTLYDILVEVYGVLTYYCPFCKEPTYLKKLQGMIIEGQEPHVEQKLYCKKCDRLLYNDPSKNEEII